MFLKINYGAPKIRNVGIPEMSGLQIVGYVPLPTGNEKRVPESFYSFSTVLKNLTYPHCLYRVLKR